MKGTFSGNSNWLTKGSTSTGFYGISGSGRVTFSFDGGVSGAATSRTNVFDGSWHHVAAVKRSGNAEIWVDGILEQSVSMLDLSTNDPGALAIGRKGACCETFTGSMDEVRIYNIALSQGEIANQAAALGPLPNRLTPSVTSLDFEYQVGIPISKVQKTFTVSTTLTSVPIQAVVSSGGNVFSVATNQTGSDARVTVSGSRSLLPGSYGGSVTISTPGTTSVIVPLSLTVTSDPKLERVPAPDSAFLISLNGAIRPDWDTIVLTHGMNRTEQVLEELWTGSAQNRAGNLLPAALGRADVNIIQYVWTWSFHDSGGWPNCDEYRAARANVPFAAERLAAELLQGLGKGYTKKIQFVGHSLGTAVNAYAASRFLKAAAQYAQAQFTALDRPDHIATQIPGCDAEDDEKYGFNPNFFYSVLHDVMGPKLRLDNYYAEPEGGASAAVGDVANGGFYNFPLVDPGLLDDYLLREEVFNNDHSGVHQWYRWTMRPNFPLASEAPACAGGTFGPSVTQYFSALTVPLPDRSLAPCNNGWYYSILRASSPEPPVNSAPGVVDLPNFETTSLKQAGGCTITQYRPLRLTCVEASSPFVALNVEIPALANALSFAFTVTAAGDGDFVSVVLDNDVIWKMAGDAFVAGELVQTGPIPLTGVAAGTHQLTIGLHGQGSKNFGFSLENLAIWKRAVDANPNTGLSSPAVGSGGSTTYTFQFSDSDGYRDLGVVNVLINNFLDGRKACYIAYDRPNNVLYLVDDAGSSINGMVLNGTGKLANGQCTILGSGSSARGSGNILTLTLNLLFQSPAFAGSKVIYTASRDRQENNSGWQTIGVHSVPGEVVSYPSPTSVSPGSGAGMSAVFNLQYTDQPNADNLQTVWGLINTAIDGRRACYFAYHRPSNKIYLVPDNGDGAQATSTTFSNSATLENSQCVIGGNGSAVTKSGTSLQLTLPITFKTGFAGPKGIWSAGQSMGGSATSAWKIGGVWQVKP